MIMAVLMAGGKGERLDSAVEKPLFKFRNKPLIEYVLENLKNSKYIEKIVVATSPNTPETTNYIDNFLNNINGNKDELMHVYNHTVNRTSTYNLIETPGNGYLEDLYFLLANFEKISDNDILVFINSDLPFVSSEIIDNVLEEYFKNDAPAMSVLVPVKIFEKYGIEPSYVFEGFVPSGLNILISQDKVQVEEKLIIPKIELALNINSINDVEVANYLFDNNLIEDISNKSIANKNIINKS